MKIKQHLKTFVVMSNIFPIKKSIILLGIATVAAAIGFGDSLYLTFSHYGDSAVVCNLLDGCNVVLGSTWATVFGIPVALFGAVYYSVLLLLLLYYHVSKREILIKVLLAVSTVGVVLSLWFLYVQLGIIGSLCEYCLLSLVSTLCVWIAVMALSRSSGDIIKSN